jgi:hypothetical protein
MSPMQRYAKIRHNLTALSLSTVRLTLCNAMHSGVVSSHLAVSVPATFSVHFGVGKAMPACQVRRRQQMLPADSRPVGRAASGTVAL